LRFKGYETNLVRELAISAELFRYRRERLLTPAGKTIIASLPKGLLGGFWTNHRRLCLVLHAQGQVTTERLSSVVNGIGLGISKRQVVRILTSCLQDFVAEDQTGLESMRRLLLPLSCASSSSWQTHCCGMDELGPKSGLEHHGYFVTQSA
jgi:hypothetical protein